MTFPQIPANSKTRISDYLSKNPAYIFHHLVKCGGSSSIAALRSWFTLVFDHLKDPGKIGYYIKHRYDIDNIQSDTCIVGHFAYEGTYLEQRYPEIFSRSNEIKTFTFVRDPLKFIISFYYYTSNQGRMKEIGLADYIDSNKNLLAYFLNCNENNFKQVLDRYFFIGIVETMQESFDKLADALNKRKIPVPFMNESVKDSQIRSITRDFTERFRRENKLDYMIYEYCLEKFQKL